MTAKKNKSAKNSIYDSIRKPTAPPSIKFGKEKSTEKIYPSLRKIKHKKKADIQNETGNPEENF